jgi:hypothetical protein
MSPVTAIKAFAVFVEAARKSVYDVARAIDDRIICSPKMNVANV